MACCPCGFAGVSLEHHYRWSPLCKPTEAPVPEPVSNRSDSADGTFTARVKHIIGTELLQAHLNYFMHLKHADVLRSLTLTVVGLVLEHSLSELAHILDDKSAAAAGQVLARVGTICKELPSASALIAQQRLVYQRVSPYSFVGLSNVDKAGAAFFSVVQLLTVMLQESAPARREVIKSSEKWKSGELLNVLPDTMTDVTHGRQFRENALICGKASATEKKDLRIVLAGWMDDFTSVDGLGLASRHHKYGAFLVTLVNLPLLARQSVDNVLLVALWRCKFAKEHGGVNRMLTGVNGHRVRPVIVGRRCPHRRHTRCSAAASVLPDKTLELSSPSGGLHSPWHKTLWKDPLHQCRLLLPASPARILPASPDRIPRVVAMSLRSSVPDHIPFCRQVRDRTERSTGTLLHSVQSLRKVSQMGSGYSSQTTIMAGFGGGVYEWYRCSQCRSTGLQMGPLGHSQSQSLRATRASNVTGRPLADALGYPVKMSGTAK